MTPSPNDPNILTVDTVTKLGPEHRDQVLIGASHGGVYAGYLAAKAGVRAVLLNDAGVGIEDAGELVADLRQALDRVVPVPA